MLSVEHWQAQEEGLIECCLTVAAAPLLDDGLIAALDRLPSHLLHRQYRRHKRPQAPA